MFVDRFKIKFHNKFYFRMSVLYSLVMIVGFSVLLGTVIQYESRRIVSGKQDSYDNRVNQLQSFTDHYVLDEVYGVMTKDIFDKVTYNFEDISNPSIYVYDKNNFEEAKSVLRFLNSLQQNADFINSVDIYNKTYDTYLSGVSGVFYQAKNNYHKYKNIIDYNLLESSFASDYNQFWLQDKEHLYFIQLMPVFKNPQDADMAFIMNVDIQKALRTLFTDINPEKETLRIIDSHEQVIYESGLSEVDNETIIQGIAGQGYIANGGTANISVNYKKYHVVWKKSTYNDWIYVYSIPYTDLIRSVLVGISSIILMGIIIFVVLVTTIWKMSSWLYKPIYQLVKISKDKSNSHATQGDLNIINEAFSNITLELNQLEDIVEKNNGLILNHIIRDLIGGRISDFTQLNNRLGVLDEKFDRDSIYLMVIKFDTADYARLSYEEKECVPLAMGELIDTYYRCRYKGGFKGASLFEYEGHLTYVVNVEHGCYHNEKVHVEEILGILQKAQLPQFNIAISNAIQNLAECYDTYQTILGYFRYSFIYGKYNVFTAESLMLDEYSGSQFSLDVIKRFSSLLKSTKFDVMKEEIGILFNEIKVQGYSYIYPYNLSVKMIEMLANECEIQNIYTEELGYENLLDDFSRLTDISDCVGWFENKLDKYAIYLEQRKADHQRELIDEILSYIEGNTHAHMSLSYVAEHFNMSTAHFSRMFKEKIGTNFSEFVINSKLDKAARLLVAEPKAKVVDIADEIGYSTLAYFNKLFKEKYGMTPTQYRKLHS